MEKHPVSLYSTQIDRWIIPFLLPLPKFILTNLPASMSSITNVDKQKLTKSEIAEVTLLNMRLELYKEILMLLNETIDPSLSTNSSQSSINTNPNTYEPGVYKQPSNIYYTQKMDTTEFQNMVERCWVHHDQYVAALTLYLPDILATNPVSNVKKYYSLSWASSASSARCTLDDWRNERCFVLINMIILGFELAGYQLRKSDKIIPTPIIITKKKASSPTPEYQLTLFRFLRTFIQDHFLCHPKDPVLINLIRSKLKRDVENIANTNQQDDEFNDNNNNNKKFRDLLTKRKIPSINDVELYQNLQIQLPNILPNTATLACLFDFTSILINEWGIIRCHLSPTTSLEFLKKYIFTITANDPLAFPVFDSNDITLDDNLSSSTDGLLDNTKWDRDTLMKITRKIAGLISKCRSLRNLIIKKENNFIMTPTYSGFVLHVLKYVTQAVSVYDTLLCCIRICMEYWFDNTQPNPNPNQDLREMMYWFEQLKLRSSTETAMGVFHRLVNCARDNGAFLTEYIKNENKAVPILAPLESRKSEQYNRTIPLQLCEINWKNYIWITRLRHEMDPAIVRAVYTWFDYVNNSMKNITSVLFADNSLSPTEYKTAPEDIQNAAKDNLTMASYCQNYTEDMPGAPRWVNNSVPSLEAIQSILETEL